MTEIIPSLAALADRYTVLFCDLWGCLHNGKTPFPEAVAALSAYRAAGGRVVLMTNAPRPNSYVIAQLDRMGVPRAAWDLVVSSGDAAQVAMFSGAVGRRVYHIGPSKDDGFFTDIPQAFAGAPVIDRVSLDEAEGIVCTGPFHEDTETPEDYRATFEVAKARGLKLLCTNPDFVVDVGDHRIYCAGALAALYHEMGGESLYFGKPHAPIYALARARLAEAGIEAPLARTLAVGDGIGTDVTGGIREGIDTLFITGGLAAAEFGPDVGNPDPALLFRWLGELQMTPTYAIGKLR